MADLEQPTTPGESFIKSSDISNPFKDKVVTTALAVSAVVIVLVLIAIFLPFCLLRDKRKRQEKSKSNEGKDLENVEESMSGGRGGSTLTDAGVDVRRPESGSESARTESITEAKESVIKVRDFG